MDGPDTRVLGLAFLQTSSEELICPREDLSVTRKEELKRLFLAHIPQVFNTVTGLYTEVLNWSRADWWNSAVLPHHSYMYVTSASFSLSFPAILEEAKNKNTGDNAVVLAALQALSHLFSWIPLADVNSLQLLSLITHFASQQVNSQNTLFILCSVSEVWEQPSPTVLKTYLMFFFFLSQQDGCGLHGLSALNELLYNNCVPGTFQSSLLSLCVHNNSLLRGALANLSNNMGSNLDPE